MTASELRELLEPIPDDHVVILSKDGEGNEFSPLGVVEAGARYVAETTWSGSVYGPDDDDSDPGGALGVPAVVLWPVN